MKKGTLLVLCCALSLSLSAQTKPEKAFRQTKAMINSGNYFFEANKAIPVAGSSISLFTNLGFIKLDDIGTEIFLPYFGEMRFGGGYNGGGAIKVNADVNNYKIKFNEKKQLINITFNTRNASERFDISMSVDRQGWTTVIVKSMHRSIISYYGRTTLLDDKQVSVGR